eukprot:TRINITY_DN30483_c0_g1_i1.p1 TRINITY_DN30483_c0_g1~~TRINITY_DN30483_c0_g1_i1.p1  ORF type:complete len:341 (+),score=38.22 TRINITY_DN30483_c0_g1_i1:152-1024(+)
MKLERSTEGVGYKWLCLLLVCILAVACLVGVVSEKLVIECVERDANEPHHQLYQFIFTPSAWRGGVVRSYQDFGLFSVSTVKKQYEDEWTLVGIWGACLPIKSSILSAHSYLTMLVFAVQFFSAFVGKSLTKEHFMINRHWWRRIWTVPLSLFCMPDPQATFGGLAAIMHAGYETQISDFEVMMTYVLFGLGGAAVSMHFQKKVYELALAPGCIIALMISNLVHSLDWGDLGALVFDDTGSISPNTPLLKLLLFIALELMRIEDLSELHHHGVTAVLVVSYFMFATCVGL